MNVSVIIPAYNEAASVGEVVRGVRSVGPDWEVVVVDDGSADGTAEAAREAGARVVRHPYNLGNGASVRSGAAAAGGDILVFMDADGQHRPEDIPQLLEHMDEYDMAVGARVKDCDVSRFRTLGNALLISTAQFLVSRPILDLTSGFRAVRRNGFEEFSHLYPQGYSYPTTITLAMFSSGRFVKYVPMPGIRRRQAGESNIRPVRDGLRFLVIMLRMIVLFNPLKVFLPLGGVVMGLAALHGLADLIAHWKLTASTVIMFIFSFFLFFFGIMADQIARVRRDLQVAIARMKSSR